MGLFSRKRKDEAVAEPTAAPKAAVAKRHGPYDISERSKVPQGYLDLGALKLPQIPGVGIQMNVTPDRRSIKGVTYLIGNSEMNVMVFAAPRSRGLWDEMRAELAATINQDTGRVAEGDGPFGPELRATLLLPSPDGQPRVMPMRVLGIDGPRWCLRAMIRGPLAGQPPNPDKLNAAENLLSAIIVDRGRNPMPPREVLDLYPAGLTESGVAVDASAASLLDPNNSRGPSIAEVR